MAWVFKNKQQVRFFLSLWSSLRFSTQYFRQTWLLCINNNYYNKDLNKDGSITFDNISGSALVQVTNSFASCWLIYIYIYINGAGASCDRGGICFVVSSHQLTLRTGTTPTGKAQLNDFFKKKLFRLLISVVTNGLVTFIVLPCPIQNALLRKKNG